MGEKRQLPLAHAAALTPALCARAMTFPVAPAFATEVALAWHVNLQATRCGYCNEDHLAGMMHVTMKAMLIGDMGRIKLNNQVLRLDRQFR